MNVVCLNGNLCKQLELRVTRTGKYVLDNALAIRINKDITEFIQIRAWAKTAELLANYCRKGDKITVEGSIRTDKYTDNGIDKYFTYVNVNAVYFGFNPQNNVQKGDN